LTKICADACSTGVLSAETDVGAQRAALSVIVEQRGDAAVGIDAKLADPKRNHEAQRAEALSEIQARGAQKRGEQVERIGKPRRAQVKAVGEAQLQGQAKQELVRICADLPHQAQRLAIRANQDVLPVVEVDAVYAHAARAAAQAARSFEDRYGDTVFCERDRCGEARPAGADDGDAAQAVTQVRHAIQSLRIGVSAVRCSSTR
jgi:hypothetical protein